jgi:ornithine cyclodeaminase/alanine dehydrogenase-like protein (mu-crystallin family)
MNYYTNEQINGHLDAASASEAIRRAYLELHRGDAAVQVRSRIAMPGAKFSSMSAMLSAERVAAVKMYTTLNGQFRFYIALFSIADGALIAMLEGDAITRVRTAATTALAARHLARPSSQTLGVFGSGVQASEHAEALAQCFDFREAFIRSTDDKTANEMAKRLRERYGIRASLTDAPQAAAANVVVLATRASEPVIQGDWLTPGSLVASIGATRPDQREIDDASIEAASRIVVDWSEQAPFETGDLLLPPKSLMASKTITDLSAVIATDTRRPDDAIDIVLYKATGMALQDAAVAHLAYTRLTAS